MYSENTMIADRYRIGKLLKEGPASRVYAAFDTRNKRPVVLKAFTVEPGRLGDIIRFHSEQQIIAEIDHSSVVKIHDHGSMGRFGGPEQYVAMEHVPGITLGEALGDGDTFTFQEIISGAINLCGALEAVHGQGLIHCDIKPENIIVTARDAVSMSVTLIDFGSARLKKFERERSGEFIDGTFACIAPEQCGLIHAAVEEASDLYSLGVLLYRLLAGTYPFKGDSLSALLHSKISRTPPLPSVYNPEVPAVLDEIVMKLLEKEPAHRYSEVSGLLHDLERISRGEYDFRPGEQDFGRVTFRSPVIGREREMSEMEEMAAQVLEGNAVYCLLTGEAGIGKTRFLQELKKSLMAKSWLVLEGRAVEHEGREPWSLFRSTMKTYLKIFQQYGMEKQERITAVFRRECADFGSIVTGLVPDLELLLGKCPPMVELDRDRESQRFMISLVRFLRALVDAEEGLAVFFDDLQWADEGSLKLIEDALKELKRTRLFVVVSTRSGEKTTGPVLELFKRLRNERGIPVRSVVLSPLGVKDVTRCLGAMLHEDGVWTSLLAEHVFRQTGGNPLFTGEMIRHLFHDGVLVREEGAWHINAEKLKSVDLPDNVMDAIKARVAALPEKAREILSRAAVIGRSFSVDILLEIIPETADTLENLRETMLVMADAARQCIVMEDVAERGMVIFTHDRIRQVFYERLRKRQRKKLHAMIIAALEEKQNEDECATLFDLAHHALESGRRDKIITYACRAGTRAMEDYAFDDAIGFLGETLKAIERDDNFRQNEDEKEIWLQAMEKYGESLVFVGRSDEGIAVFERLLNENIDNNKNAYYYQYLTLASLRKGDFKNCESYASEGLKLFGEIVPGKKSRVILGTIKEIIIHLFRPRYISKKYNANEEKANIVRNIISCYKWLLYTYYWHDGWKGLRVILRMGNLCEKYLSGSKELAELYYHYGLLFTTTGFYKRAEFFLSLSTKLHEENNNEKGCIQTLNGKALVLIMKGQFQESLELCKQGIQRMQTIGDYVEISKFSQFIIFVNYFMSNYREAFSTYNYYFYINKSFFDELTYGGTFYPLREYIEKADYINAEKMIKRYATFLEKNKIWFLYAVTLSSLGRLYHEQGLYAKSKEVFAWCMHIIKKELLPMHFLNMVYPFYCDTLIMEYNDNNTQNSISKMKTLYIIKKYIKKGLRSTKCFNHHHDVALRVAGKYFLLKNNIKKAESYFIQAVDKSHAMGKRYEEARTRYEYGLWLLERKEYERAWVHLDRSYMLFREIDIPHYQQKILALMENEGERRSPLRRFLDRERKDHVMACVEGIGNYGGYRELLDYVAQCSMEICGARSCGLFIADTDTSVLRLEVRASVDESDFEYSQHIVDECFSTRRLIITTSAEESEDYSPYHSVASAGLKSILCLPLQRNDLLIGVCYLDNSLAAGVFSRDDARLMQYFLSTSVIRIENALLAGKLKEGPAPKEDDETAMGRDYCSRAIECIEKRFCEEFSREDVARELGVNPDYLGKVFKAHIGRSIHDYTNEVRVKWALEELKNTDRRVIDVAFDAGFESLRTFNRSFYRVTGESPKKYRQNCKP